MTNAALMAAPAAHAVLTAAQPGIWSSVWPLIAVPVVVAALTAAATMIVTRAGDAAARRQEHYADAVKTLVAWAEYPYRVRRRTDDEPATLAQLAGLAHDLQGQLACHEAWITADHARLAGHYAKARFRVSEAVGPAITDAWNRPPISAAADMNLGGWGPGAAPNEAVTAFQCQIGTAMGWRRLIRVGAD